MSLLQSHEPRAPVFQNGPVDVPPPAPDIVPTFPTPHPMPPGAPPEIPPFEQPPEIIEPPSPGEHTPVRDPMVPGNMVYLRSARVSSMHSSRPKSMSIPSNVTWTEP